MKKRLSLEIAGFFTFAVGIIFLVNSQMDVTGAIIGTDETFSLVSFFIGIVLIIVSILLLSSTISLENRIRFSSSIKDNPSILKLTKSAMKNESVQQEANHLIEELSRGNFEAGLGHLGHVPETDIFYIRGKKGARIYYHRIGKDEYEIVGKSAKENEQDVIDKLKEIYSTK
jgi:competence protein ComGC